MKRGKDISVSFPGLYLVHHNLPGKKVDFHSHAEHTVFFPLQGEIKVMTRTGVLGCGSGRCLYLPDKTDHAFESNHQLGERLIALVQTSVWKKNASPIKKPLVAVAPQLAKELLFYLLLNPKTPHAKSLVATFIQTLGESLSAHSEVGALTHLESKVSDPRIRKALEFLPTHLQEPLSMETVAKVAGLSLRNLNRLFLQEVGLTPKQLQIQLRVERAKELLQEGKYSVTEVALEVGYNSLTQFISVFRSLTGSLPSDFRN